MSQPKARYVPIAEDALQAGDLVTYAVSWGLETMVHKPGNTAPKGSSFVSAVRVVQQVEMPTIPGLYAVSWNESRPATMLGTDVGMATLWWRFIDAKGVVSDRAFTPNEMTDVTKVEPLHIFRVQDRIDA